MASVSTSQIKELRERTGVGMAKCKEALEKSSGNMDDAIDFLRKSGMASAVKKASRESNEGKIFFAETPDTVAIVEVNSETDFVANNDRFLEFAQGVAEEIATTKPASVESFLTQKSKKDPNMTIDELRGVIVQAIGENIQIKRFLVIPKSSSRSVGVYSHLGGKILTVVEIEGSNEALDVAKDIAMHAAAAAPEYLSPEAVPAEVIEKEKAIAREQLSGKPANIIDKILEGKLNAFFDEHCLLRQKFIKDDTQTITKLVESTGKGLNKDLVIKNFIRWSVG